jgi:hypothetical protein
LPFPGFDAAAFLYGEKLIYKGASQPKNSSFSCAMHRGDLPNTETPERGDGFRNFLFRAVHQMETAHQQRYGVGKHGFLHAAESEKGLYGRIP